MAEVNLPAEDSQHPSAKVTTTEVFSPYPELLEYLHNLVQDASASGAIVHLITIFPPHMQIETDGKTNIFGCGPTAGTCPK